VIVQSHQRCAALGLSRIERPDFSPLGRPDLSLVRERNRRLHGHAAPVMEMLFDQIAGTESMVVLCDSSGTILHSVGDDEFLARAQKVALQPGVNWSEQSKGTNAIGTALIDEVPTLVHADEHFMHANHFLTCSAAPILDPRGNILGVLDVTGDRRSYHQHTMALVKMSARMIENHWLSDDHRDAMRLHFHTRAEFIGTLMEGILAVAPDGRIVGANRSALEQLGLSGAALRQQSLGTLFGLTVGGLADRFRNPLGELQVALAGGGRAFHLQARFNWPSWAATPVGRAVDGDAAGAAAGAEPADPPSADPVVRIRTERGPGLAHLNTGDAQMGSLLAKVQRVIDRDIPILVLGETGTGKELLARAIHQASARARQPFVAVNCASIPDTLIEAELFGYEDGAFTGARRKGAVGKILQANGGTLFLDEIGDMPLPLQAHLLRVLQERQVTPLGSARSLPVDVSLVCATHRNLRDMIDARAFREDLYYRLNGLAVRLPPLRERSDLVALVRRILDAGEPDRGRRLDAEVLGLFESYTWPGNVRQLHNVLRTAVVMAGAQQLITREHLPDDFLEDVHRHRRAGTALAAVPAAPVAASAAAASAMGAMAAWATGMPPAEHTPRPAAPPPPPVTAVSLEELELRAIAAAVDEAGGNISVAAKRLGVSRNTIYRKLRWKPSSPA
jgi:transcriptional regulator of acetoin/glycerol metabolism